MSVRAKRILRMIDRRKSREDIALTIDIIRSWNGTTAHAMLKPGARPPRSRTNETSSR
jgi:hypothetical protein